MVSIGEKLGGGIMADKLKVPFPYFGGKKDVASLIWARLGNPPNYIEPFFGSGATLLLRPDPPSVETANDLDCYLANFWRATSRDPDAVADHVDGPVNETDLHARHRWLVLSDDAATFRDRMRTDPDYFDPKIAGWWCWGLCCWIGSGWCAPDHLRRDGLPLERVRGEGRGLNAKRPRSHRAPSSDGAAPSLPGVLSQQIPLIDHTRGGHRAATNLTQGRPQLGDAYDIGRGVHSHGDLGTCEARRRWLYEWFGRLRDRLRNVRVCCGDWLRVCDSESVTTRLGVTGIFLDPPYGAAAGRSAKLYSQDSLTVAEAVRAYCLERGTNRLMRICLAGYAGEGHEVLEQNGWSVVEWRANGGYGNNSATGKANARKERLWFSPHCIADRGLFDAA
jgi:site-specific DNA-adenine methylase